MRPIKPIAIGCVAAFVGWWCCAAAAYGQCNAPEVVRGADKYNARVCEGYLALGASDYDAALGHFLAAASTPNVLESPNLRLFGRIAYVYAKLGRFREADTYLEYDNLSLLWLIGIVRCKSNSDYTKYSLLKDGHLLSTGGAAHMVNVLCGMAFDEYSDFRDRDADSFVPAAQMILRHAEIRSGIEKLRRKR